MNVNDMSLTGLDRTYTCLGLWPILYTGPYLFLWASGLVLDFCFYRVSSFVVLSLHDTRT